MSALSAVAVFIVIGVVAAVAAPKSSTPRAASTPAATTAPSSVTDPNGQTCTALNSAGYCPGDDPTPTPSPTPSGPAQLAIGQTETLADSSNATEGTVTVMSATVGTQPADPSFGQAPANGYYVVHVSATADNSYTTGFSVNTLDFYAKSAGQHFYEGNGNAFEALSSGQQNQDVTATLAAGETTTGYLAFDMPRPHGFIVYAPNFDGQPLAEWAY